MQLELDIIAGKEEEDEEEEDISEIERQLFEVDKKANEKLNDELSSNLDKILSTRLSTTRYSTKEEDYKIAEPKTIERPETEPERLARSALEAQERIKLKKAEKALAEEKARKEMERTV